MPIDLESPAVSWDDLRVFAFVCEAKSLSRAAARLGLQASTVSRSVKALEDSLGAALLLRSPDGAHPTALGLQVFEHARRMLSTVEGIERAARSTGEDRYCRVRLSVTEGLGRFWVLPRLVQYQRENPHVRIDARCTMELADTLRAEADLAIQYTPPAAADLKAVRLGVLHMMPFTSRAYVERFGIPASIADFAKHKIVLHGGPQLNEVKALEKLGIENADGLVSFRTDSGVVCYDLIKGGAGIGPLASYAACIDRALVPIEVPGLHEPVEIWLTFHPQAKNMPHVAAMIEWVHENFDKKRFPFFRDEFIPPSKLRELPTENWQANMLDRGGAADLTQPFGRGRWVR